MAKEKEKEAAVEVEQPPKGKKKLFIILAVVLLVVLGAAGGAAYLLLSTPAEEGQAKHGEEEAAGEEHPPVYEKLDSFTTRLADGESYLQCEINLKLADAKLQEKIKVYMPEIKDGILRLLASQNADELATVEGKDKLALEVQKTVNDILGVKKASEGVLKVLFPAFIIQ
jgi:flagellar FliL protein